MFRKEIWFLTASLWDCMNQCITPVISLGLSIIMEVDGCSAVSVRHSSNYVLI